MLRAVLRDMRAHLGRVAMTMVAIVLGVAFVVATWVVSDSAAETIANGSSRSDLAVQVTANGPDAKLTAADREKLAALPGVRRATGVVIGHAAVVQSNGKLGDTYYPPEGGTSWDNSDRFALVSGRGPAASGEVALEEEVAKDAGLAVGATARMLKEDGTSESATVVGIFTYRKAGVHEGTPAVAYDQATAMRILGESFARVELFGADQTRLADAAKTAMGADFAVETGAELAADRKARAEEDAKMMRNFLLAFAGVALLAGMFVIANTFTMLVAQRTRHFALLRAVGAKRRQVRRAVLVEAAVLGLLGATIGSAIGVGMGWLTMRWLRTTGETVVFAVSPLAILVGYLVGVLVTVVAAYGSARRGAAVAPVAALGTDAALPRRSLVVRTVAGSLAMAGGVIAVVATSGSTLTDPERVVGMGGGLIGWLAVILLAPLLASAVLLPLSHLVSRRGSAVSRLAVRNAIRDPRRTAATASALMIGLALVTAFATVGASLESALTEEIKNDVPARTSVVQSASAWSGVQKSVLDKVRGVSGVDSVASPMQGFGMLVQGTKQSGLTITSVEGDALGKALTPVIVAGKADLANGVLLAQSVADERGIKVGDTITVSPGQPGSPDSPSQGEFTAKVTGIYAHSQVFRGVVVNRSVMPANATDYLAAIYVTGGDPAAVGKALDAAFADRPDVVVLDREAVIKQYTAEVDLALNIVYALLGAAVIIAVFGVVNTLALSVLERTREIGVFRAVGATRTLVRRSVRRESVVIASYGGLLGVVVGVLLGGVMQHVITGAPIFDLAVPLPVVASALGGMVVVGVLAALWPARRAARTDVLEAIATS